MPKSQFIRYTYPKTYDEDCDRNHPETSTPFIVIPLDPQNETVERKGIRDSLILGFFRKLDGRRSILAIGAPSLIAHPFAVLEQGLICLATIFMVTGESVRLDPIFIEAFLLNNPV